VRISITPNPLSKQTFKQQLYLQNGEIAISYGDTKIRFWIDANHPVIQTDITSSKPVQVKVAYQNWRKEKRPITGDEAKSVWGLGPNQMSNDCPKEIYQYPDTILKGNKNIIALHHNASSIWTNDMSVQNLSGFTKDSDPLLNRNFGVMISGKGLTNISDTMLVSKKSDKHFQIQIFPLTQMGSISSWVKQINLQAANIQKIPVEKRWVAHTNWWQNFWNRSYIYVSARDAKDTAEQKAAEKVTTGYILQRYMNACSGRGNSPIKFNGSIFNVDTYNRKGEHSGHDADFRLWGGCYWFQNTRLPYWSMLEAGDFDLMKPLFNMYMKALPQRMYATKKYYRHDGAFFPETMNFWGTYADSDYGCDRDSIADGYAKNPYIRYYWQGGLELSLMMEDYYNFTKRETFAKDTLVPFVAQILAFYNQHWKRGSDGKILFDPAHSLETFQTGVVNPLPEIVGSRVVAEKMLALPEKFTNATLRNQWKKLMNDLPDVPLRVVNNDTLLAPAQQYGGESNIENPELYAVFPYRDFMIGKPDLSWALNAYKFRKHKENGGWQQNSIQAAYLGFSKDAKKMIVESFSTWDKNFRFPAFWGPNYDWTPDQTHGSVAMTALQRMILQYDNDKITLLPAWPKEWNVNFKLCGPGSKVYKGVYKNGKLEKIK